MRPATSKGLTPGEQRFVLGDETKISLIEDGIGQHLHFEPNLWIGEDIPTFKFVTFALASVGIDSRVQDGLMVSLKDIKILETKKLAFVKSVNGKDWVRYPLRAGGLF
jgi:hypothetical protein